MADTILTEDDSASYGYFNIEVTDTYAGNANYCWVRRYSIENKWNHLNGKSLQREVIKAVKNKIGWTGIRCEVYGDCDHYTIHPRNMCQVCFVDWSEERNP